VRVRQSLLLGTCLLCVASGGAALWYSQVILKHVESWEGRLRLPLFRTQFFDDEGAMQTLTDQWTCQGVMKTVTTQRGLNESDADFIARHNGLVAAQLALFPPDK